METEPTNVGGELSLAAMLQNGEEDDDYDYDDYWNLEIKFKVSIIYSLHGSGAKARFTFVWRTVLVSYIYYDEIYML